MASFRGFCRPAASSTPANMLSWNRASSLAVWLALQAGHGGGQGLGGGHIGTHGSRAFLQRGRGVASGISPTATGMSLSDWALSAARASTPVTWAAGRRARQGRQHGIGWGGALRLQLLQQHTGKTSPSFSGLWEAVLHEEFDEEVVHHLAFSTCATGLMSPFIFNHRNPIFVAQTRGLWHSKSATTPGLVVMVFLHHRSWCNTRQTDQRYRPVNLPLCVLRSLAASWDRRALVYRANAPRSPCASRIPATFS